MRLFVEEIGAVVVQVSYLLDFAKRHTHRVLRYPPVFCAGLAVVRDAVSVFILREVLPVRSAKAAAPTEGNVLPALEQLL